MAGYTFNQLIDFTRTSAATFVNSSGNIASTPQSRNLLTFTQEFDNAAWTKADTTITANSTAAPDGTMTADTLVAAATTAAHTIRQTGGGSGSPHTLSIYAKAGTSNFIQLYHASVSTIYANFNVAAGTVGTVGAGATAAITSVGNGWYRCSITFTPGSVSTSRVAMITSATAVYAESWTAAGTETVFIWGAQLEQASAATDYTRNFGGLFPPRFDYDPVSLAPRGLLIEEQRTNLLLRSEDFTTSWGAVSTTVTADTTVAPDGTTTADTLTAATTGAYVQQNVTFTGDGDKAYSVFLKAGTSTTTRLTLRDTTASVNRGSVDITWTAGVASGVATVGTLQGIDSFGNGWYRVRMLATGVVAANTNQFRFSPDPSAGTGTSIMWGAQTENGAFSTSYIPTVASQVTRTADVAAINAPNFASWYNQTEGTIFVEAVTYKPTTVVATGLAVDVSDGGVNNRHYVGTNSASAEARTVVGGVNQAVINQAYTANATEKLAYAYKVNDFAFFRNGSQVGTDTSGTIPTVDRMFIGNAAGSAAFWRGWLRSIRYYPTRLTQAQGEALTA